MLAQVSYCINWFWAGYSTGSAEVSVTTTKDQIRSRAWSLTGTRSQKEVNCLKLHTDELMVRGLSNQCTDEFLFLLSANILLETCTVICLLWYDPFLCGFTFWCLRFPSLHLGFLLAFWSQECKECYFYLYGCALMGETPFIHTYISPHGAGAYSSCDRLRGGTHPGEVTSLISTNTC